MSISGFATSLRPPEQATRSQKAFMAIARRMAALPKLPVGEQEYVGSNQFGISRSTQNILESSESPEQREAEELQALNAELAEMPAELRPTFSRESDVPGQSLSLDELRRMHQTLDMRLQPFWSSSVPNRSVILSVFVDQDQGTAETIEETSFTPLEQGKQPLFMIQTSTDAQGVFREQFSIPYERICTHPESLSIAFGGYNIEPKVSNHKFASACFTVPTAHSSSGVKTTPATYIATGRFLLSTTKENSDSYFCSDIESPN